MPRNSSGIFSRPAGTTAVPNTTIASAAYNTAMDDIAADLNAARPVTAGGTGATDISAAQTNLGLTNFAKTLVDDPDAAAALQTLGLGVPGATGLAILAATTKASAKSAAGVAPVAFSSGQTGGTIGTNGGVIGSIDWTATGPSIMLHATFPVEGATQTFAYARVDLYNLTSQPGSPFYTSTEIVVLHNASGLERMSVPVAYQGLITGSLYRAVLVARTSAATINVVNSQIHGLCT